VKNFEAAEKKTCCKIKCGRSGENPIAAFYKNVIPEICG
jgi:hypothetical protein